MAMATASSKAGAGKRHAFPVAHRAVARIQRERAIVVLDRQLQVLTLALQETLGREDFRALRCQLQRPVDQWSGLLDRLA